MHILVIEDSDTIASMLQALVEARGHAVQTVATGAQGVEVVRAEPPDVVVLDWSLTGTVSSEETCRRIQAAGGAAPPVVALGVADEDEKARAMGAGAHAYYTKPWSPLALLKEIEGLRTRSSGRIRAAKPPTPGA